MPKTPEDRDVAIPTGTIFKFSGGAVPYGYLLCDGAAVLKTTYTLLDAVLSAASYPYGSAPTTFNVPDARGRALVGAGTYTDSVSGPVTRTLGQSLGSEKYVLTAAELANHTHSPGTMSISGGSHGHGTSDPGHGHSLTTPNIRVYAAGNASQCPNGSFHDISPGSVGVNASTTGISINSSNHSHSSGEFSGATGAVGSGTSHQNMQPSLVVNFIIKYT